MPLHVCKDLSIEVWCCCHADGRPDAFNMGSLRTELHIPAAFQSAHSIEECPETDEDSDEDADEGDDEDVMVLGSTPQVLSPLHMQERAHPAWEHACGRALWMPRLVLDV